MPLDFGAVVDKGGTVGLLVFIVIAFARRWVVPAYVADDLLKQVERMRGERDQAQAVADRCLSTLQQLADTIPALRQRIRGGPP